MRNEICRKGHRNFSLSLSLIQPFVLFLRKFLFEDGKLHESGIHHFPYPNVSHGHRFFLYFRCTKTHFTLLIKTSKKILRSVGLLNNSHADFDYWSGPKSIHRSTGRFSRRSSSFPFYPSLNLMQSFWTICIISLWLIMTFWEAKGKSSLQYFGSTSVNLREKIRGVIAALLFFIIARLLFSYVKIPYCH